MLFRVSYPSACADSGMDHRGGAVEHRRFTTIWTQSKAVSREGYGGALKARDKLGMSVTSTGCPPNQTCVMRAHLVACAMSGKVRGGEIAVAGVAAN